ncbi:MAG: DUF929 family protein [Candidatus Micrarchaeota archaeon]|nr:DUF929 family protein [Candidatus Micrarchaeota archaeon]MDE1804542.1 DUF929 family protein [Candidatus Micrarchaeota archaeon]MDE1846902.1 DUF929 family protein [Candidatus Micrarchaeota archaeon]
MPQSKKRSSVSQQPAHIAQLKRTIRTLTIISTTALMIGIVAILLAAIPIVSAALKGPAPNFGHTIAGINNPLTPSQLAVINNASNSAFEAAGEAFLSGNFSNVGGFQRVNTTPLIINGKPSVVYLGAISCIYCGENRWAMALALSRFGSFSKLYIGYSALGDGDVPTLYWLPAAYNETSGVNFGSNYSSSYINFLPIEYISPIKSGFQMQPLSFFQQKVNQTQDTGYSQAVNMIIRLNSFQGTPYTIWGNSVVPGADGSIFSNQTTQLTNMTHQQVLNQIQASTGLGSAEYAAADLYIAMICESINNAAPVCSLPAIPRIEAKGY